MACGGVSGGISNLSWCDSLHVSLEDSRSNTEAATQSMAAARTAELSSQSDATTPRACKALHKARACSGDRTSARLCAVRYAASRTTGEGWVIAVLIAATVASTSGPRSPSGSAIAVALHTFSMAVVTAAA